MHYIYFFKQYAHFIKWFFYILSLVFLFAFVYYEGYKQGKEQSFKDAEIAELNAQIVDYNQQVNALNEQLALKQQELEIEKANTRVVTEYKTKQVIIEKEKPVYEKKIERIFVDRPVEYVDDELVRLHDDFVCSNQIQGAESSCPVDDSTDKHEPVTQEQFTKRVIDNYRIGIDNANKLHALQQTITEQQEITENDFKTNK